MAHKPPKHHQPTPPKPPPPTHHENQRRKQLIQQWTQQHGNTCPGHQCPPHPTTPPNKLTADHTTPRRHGGETGPLTILCQTCNTRRRNNEQ